MKSIHKYICEKLGGFYRQDEFILTLANDIAQNLEIYPNETLFVFNRKKLENNKFKFLFFDELKIIHANDNKYNTYYTKYNADKKIFDSIGININFQENYTYKKIAKILAHELLHAYEDFNRHINNRETLKNFFNRNEINSKPNKFNYKKTLKEDFPEFRMLLNNLSQIEQNAYLNELNVELETSDFDIFRYKTFKDAYNAAFKIIFNDENSSYKIYLDGLTILDSLSGEDAENFKNVYNDINKSNLSFNKIYKKLNNILDTILTKIENRILTIFKDYYNKKMEEIKYVKISRYA